MLSGGYSFLRCSASSLSCFPLLQSTGSRRTGSSAVVHALVAPWPVESSWTRDRTHVSYIGRQILLHCVSKEVPLAPSSNFHSHWLPHHSKCLTISHLETQQSLLPSLSASFSILFLLDWSSQISVPFPFQCHFLSQKPSMFPHQLQSHSFKTHNITPKWLWFVSKLPF